MIFHMLINLYQIQSGVDFSYMKFAYMYLSYVIHIWKIHKLFVRRAPLFIRSDNWK